MSTTVQHDKLAVIPPEIANSFGIKEGTCLEWIDAGDGVIEVKPILSRGERARKLMGAGRHWLKPGDDPIAELIMERESDDQ